MTTTCRSGSSSLAARSTPKPSPFGSLRSVSTTRGPRLAHLLDGFGLVARLDHRVALRFERVAQHRAQRVLVLDEEHAGATGMGAAGAVAIGAIRAGRRPCGLLPGGRPAPWCAAGFPSSRDSSSVSAFCRSAPPSRCRCAGSSRAAKLRGEAVDPALKRTRRTPRRERARPESTCAASATTRHRRSFALGVGLRIRPGARLGVTAGRRLGLALRRPVFAASAGVGSPSRRRRRCAAAPGVAAGAGADAGRRSCRPCRCAVAFAARLFLVRATSPSDCAGAPDVRSRREPRSRPATWVTMRRSSGKSHDWLPVFSADRCPSSAGRSGAAGFTWISRQARTRS